MLNGVICVFIITRELLLRCVSAHHFIQNKVKNDPLGWDSAPKKRKSDATVDLILQSKRARGFPHYQNNGVELPLQLTVRDEEEDVYVSPSPLSSPSSSSSSSYPTTPRTPSSISSNDVIDLDSSDEECIVIDDLDNVSQEQIAQQEKLFSFYEGICIISFNWPVLISLKANKVKQEPIKIKAEQDTIKQESKDDDTFLNEHLDIRPGMTK